jgi:ankyrin repeat protein
MPGFIIQKAYGEGNEDELRSAVEIERRDDPFWFHDIVWYGNVDLVGKILDMFPGIDLNQRDDFSMYPLSIAAFNKNVPLVQKLLVCGANINAGDPEQAVNSALREVVSTADLGMVQLLLKAGANPNLRGWMGLSAVDAAKDRMKDQGDEESRKILEAIQNAAMKE